MQTLFYIIISTSIVSILAFSGILFVSFSRDRFNLLISFFVSLSIGTLLGGAFFHLIPESIEHLNSLNTSMGLVIVGIFLFLFLEKLVRWRHCHDGECPFHAFAYLNLVGDGLHNFVDGIAIASAYLVNFHLGVATTVAVFFHELPQEIGDFGVLVYGGFKKSKALFFNFISALTAMAGGIGTFYFSKILKTFSSFIPPIAAGGFLYIALSDLIPEFHKKGNFKGFLVHFLITIFGILIMLFLKSFQD